MEKVTATVDLLAREDAAKTAALEEIKRRLDAIERRIERSER
jgi:tetrahydromethanopterin S-methyltransferase subunit G